MEKLKLLKITIDDLNKLYDKLKNRKATKEEELEVYSLQALVFSNLTNSLITEK